MRLPYRTAMYVLLAATGATYAECEECEEIVEVFYVDAGASGGNGSSWEEAITNLKFVIDYLAGPCDEIRVAQGTYYTAYCPYVDGDPPPDPQPYLCDANSEERGETFDLEEKLTLKGGYRGCDEWDNGVCQSGDPDDRDPDTFITILSGDLNHAIYGG